MSSTQFPDPNFKPSKIYIIKIYEFLVKPKKPVIALGTLLKIVKLFSCIKF